MSDFEDWDNGDSYFDSFNTQEITEIVEKKFWRMQNTERRRFMCSILGLNHNSSTKDILKELENKI